MAFKNPVISPLNENQERLLAQLGSLKNILTLPVKKQLNIALEKQISSFDYLVRIAQATVGQAFVDILIKKFIDQIFDPNNDKLERLVLTSIAKSLDSQNKKISNNPEISNEEWLIDNALPSLHLIFQEVKVLIVKQIIAMIFGPKEKMSHSNISTANMEPTPTASQILNDVVAAESMFSS